MHVDIILRTHNASCGTSVRNSSITQPINLSYMNPAEEGPQGKYRMLENGCFKDIDAALMTHASVHNSRCKIFSGKYVGSRIYSVLAHESLTLSYRSATDARLLQFKEDS